MKLSPIEVELLRNGLTGVCDEMFIAIMKSAYSTNIKERHDHSACIFDARRPDRGPRDRACRCISPPCSAWSRW